MGLTSFYFPKKKSLGDIILLEDGEYSDTFMSIAKYKKLIDDAVSEKMEEVQKKK